MDDVKKKITVTEDGIEYEYEFTEEGAPNVEGFLTKIQSETQREVLNEDARAERQAKFDKLIPFTSKKIKESVPKEVQEALTEKYGEKRFYHEKEIIADKQPFKKTFTDLEDYMESGAWSKEAMRILWYMIKRLRKDDPYVYISISILQEDLGYKTPNSVAKGINELKEQGILYTGRMKGEYFISPIYICNGDRTKIVNK